MIEFVDVRKQYGDLVVLNDLSFKVGEGKKVSLIGPSGSGKTTVLRVLMTLEEINRGEIFVDGKPLTHEVVDGKKKKSSKKYVREIRKKLGMVFQHFNLFPHMKVIDNCMKSQIKVLKMSKDEAYEKSIELLDMVGLRDKIDHYPAQLSGGQQQRVAIARALAMEPEIMLFDEITSALDPELVGEVLNVLRELGKRSNMTMLLVTHEMNFAKEFSDWVMFFYKGQILEQGPPQQIFNSPHEERTQQFLKSVLEH